MTTSAGPVDWEAAERGQRRRELLVAPLLVAALLAGIVLLTGRFALWSGGAAWLAVGVLLAVMAAIAAAQRSHPGRRRYVDAHRIQVALRQHVDPGPGLRPRVDVQARYVAAVSWIGWCFLLGPLGLLLGGQWGRQPAAAAAGAVLVLGAAVGVVRWWRAQVADARRWLADPPGPSREMPAPTATLRWLGGGRAVAFLAVCLLLAVVAGFVAALVVGS